MRAETLKGDVGPHTLKLADGRRLAWREYGDSEGVPCVYTTGTPASGLAGALYDDAARRADVRWISVDKPGYGHSDFQPNRRLLDWADDVTSVAAHLGLGRFAVAGESGGGPHALALGHALGRRVLTCVVLAGMGPGHEPSVRQGMKRQNKVIMGMAQRAPWAVLPSSAAIGWLLANPKRAGRYMLRQAAAAPPGDRHFLSDPVVADIFLKATQDAFRTGPRAAAQELVMLARPWGFNLSEVVVHVDLWHGTEDANVPVAIAQAMVAQLPDCNPRIVEGAGHTVAWARLDEIMATVAQAA